MRGEEIQRIDVLIKESHRLRYDNPREMVYLAELAVAGAAALPAERYGVRLVADARARADLALGNAYRLTDHLGRAEAALRSAIGWLRRGSGDLRLLALIGERFASLLWHRRRIPEALALLDKVYGFYQGEGERHLAGRVLIARGAYTENLGDPAEAVALTCEGLSLIDRKRDPELVLAGIHNLLWCATSLRRFRLVRELIPDVRPHYAGKRLNLLRLRWIEGRVAAGFGERLDAEQAFGEAKQGFLAAGLLFPACMISLDLALLFAGADETERVAAIAEELLASFRSLGIEREALLALMLLKNAAAKERTPAAVLTKLIEDAARSLKLSNLGR